MYKQVGRSEHTRLKQKNLKYFLEVYFCITKAILAKNKWANQKMFYADIFAGDGGEENISGSPVIFENVNYDYKIPCSPIFIEENPVTVHRLESKIVSPVINNKNENILPYISPLKNQYGLLYVDPNGDPPFNLLSRFYQKRNTNKIDLLIYFSGTTIKRCLKAPSTKRNVNLKNNILSLPKKHWLIRSFVGKHQWSFLLGTNWIDFPKLKKIDFYKIDSKYGQNILNNINYTAKELKSLNITKQAKQLLLFEED